MFEALANFFSFLFTVMLVLGGVLLVGVAGYFWLTKRASRIRAEFAAKQKWVYLTIKVPKINLQSTLAVEQIFAQLHVIAENVSWVDKHLRGRQALWYSFEIVSLGGQILFIIRVPEKYHRLAETAVYAQYPDAQIEQVKDYFENLASEQLELWGAEILLTNHWSSPIRTYREFEHQLAAEKIIDPLKPLFEALAGLQPHEMYAVQVLARPLLDKAWKRRGEEEAQKLTSSTPGQTRTAQLPETTRNAVSNILHKLTKPGFEVKIRHLYAAPLGKFDGMRQSVGLGAYQTLGNLASNQFRVDTGRSSLQVKPFVWDQLEKKWLAERKAQRKSAFLGAFKARDIETGSEPIVLNTEELATLYHLPLINETNALSASMPAVAVRTSQPPANLPVGELD